LSDYFSAEKVNVEMNINFFIGIFITLFIAGCGGALPVKNDLKYSDKRTVIILGENVEPAIAEYFQKKYDGLVWFTPYEGNVANFTSNMVESGIGASKPMRSLIAQLKGINQTIGRWEIYIPRMAEKYFIRTLKHMENGALSKARGAVILIDSVHAPEIKREMARVSKGGFFVEFETDEEVVE